MDFTIEILEADLLWNCFHRLLSFFASRVWGNHFYFIVGPEPFTCRQVLRMRKIKQQWKDSLGLISFEDVPQHNQLGGNVISAAELMKVSPVETNDVKNLYYFFYYDSTFCSESISSQADISIA